MFKNTLLITLCMIFISSLQSQPENISDQLKLNLQSRLDAGDIKGIVIGTTHGGQDHYFSKGILSETEKEPVDENTLFEIGSISKTFTGLMLADMVVQGKVKLDDNIQQYLPEGIEAPMRNSNSIKLFHLANHTSGLPRLPANLSPANNFNPYADYTEAKLYQFLDGYELPRDIGQSYEYSNLAAGLLGHLLASIHGSSYETLLATAITEPLGMKHTGITQVDAPLAKGHMAGNEIPNWDFGAMEGAGAIRSTTADMMRYLKANMGLTDSKLYAAMQLSHKNSGAAESNPVVGLGWHIMTYEGKEIIWHNGATGGYTSFMGWIKGTNIGVVVLNNSTENVDEIGLHTLVPSFPLKAIRQSIAVDEAILKSYVGAYALSPNFILTVTLEGDQLSVQATGQSALPIYAESNTRFFYKVVDAQLEFQKNAGGEVESVTLYQAGQEMVGKRLE